MLRIRTESMRIFSDFEHPAWTSENSAIQKLVRLWGDARDSIKTFTALLHNSINSYWKLNIPLFSDGSASYGRLDLLLRKMHRRMCHSWKRQFYGPLGNAQLSPLCYQIAIRKTCRCVRWTFSWTIVYPRWNSWQYFSLLPLIHNWGSKRLSTVRQSQSDHQYFRQKRPTQFFYSAEFWPYPAMKLEPPTKRWIWYSHDVRRNEAPKWICIGNTFRRCYRCSWCSDVALCSVRSPPRLNYIVLRTPNIYRHSPTPYLLHLHAA